MSWSLFWFIMWLTAFLGIGAVYDISRRAQLQMENVIGEAAKEALSMRTKHYNQQCEIERLESEIKRCEERFQRIMIVATNTEDESASDYEVA